MDDAPDFSFVSDARLRELLEQYYQQALNALGAQAYVGTLALSRAVLEGLLTWRLELDRDQASAKYRELAPEKTWQDRKPLQFQIGGSISL